MLRRFEKHPLAASAVLLAIFFLVVNLTRPAIPVDETRYLTVAWEFMARGAYILPTLNFEPYHHKPPMLFWLIDAVWALFGSQLWVARLVPYGAAIGTLALTASFARALFPARPAVVGLSLLLLAGALPFAVYSSVIMFDWLLTVCVLLGLIALVRAAQRGRALDWLLLALAIGLGGLVKGPVVLLHLLSAALLIPLCGLKKPDVAMRHYAAGVALAVFAGVALVLFWATPAALIGGQDYARMIFIGQSAGRITSAFDHARPFWWYAALLPAFLVPWIFWPRVWRAVRALVTARPADSAIRFLAIWVGLVLLAFSLISGKQVHYLFPALPGLFVLLAAAICHSAEAGSLRTAARGVVLVYGLLALGHMGAAGHVARYYDLTPVARVVNAAQAEGRPIALARPYHGEIGYQARLTAPIAPFEDIKDAKAWLEKNPRGIILTRYRNPDNTGGLRIVAEQPYRSKTARFAVLEKGTP